MSKVTIQSIAKEMGLSRNTVSLALKGSELVSPNTANRILRFAERSGYLDNSQPEEFYEPETKETREALQIMILRKTDNAVYWDKVIGGISGEASMHNCQTRVAVIASEAEQALQLPIGFNKEIKAVFCVNLFSKEYLRKIRDMGIMIFTLDTYVEYEGEQWGDVVIMESHKAVQEIVQHLIKRGIRKIGFLNEHSNSYESMYDRYTGCIRAIECAGLELDRSIILPDMECDNFYALETFERIVDSIKEMPEAIVCGNDEIAKMLTQTLRNKGFQVPKDVAVTGFDNDEEGMLNPFFTTVHLDSQWMGRRMVQCFLKRLKYPDAPYEKIVISGKVIIRKSSLR